MKSGRASARPLGETPIRGMSSVPARDLRLVVMLLYPHRRLVARARLEVRGRLEGLTCYQLLGLDRPVAKIALDLVGAAALIVDRGYSVLVELLDVVLRALTVLQVCLVIESVEGIRAFEGSASSGHLVAQNLLIGRFAELRVLIPGRAPAGADDLGSVERVIVDNVDHDATRRPAVVRPQRCANHDRRAKSDDADRDIAGRIPIERPPSRIGPRAIDDPRIINWHVEIVRLIGLDDDVFGWQR